MTMLAFVARFEGEEWCSLVHGETRGKAKSRFYRAWADGWNSWNEVRLRRLPGQDDTTFDYETAKAAGFEYHDEYGDGSPAEFMNDCDCEICGGKR
jgi:hypothetical protein